MLRAISNQLSALIEREPMSIDTLHAELRKLVPADAWIKVSQSLASHNSRGREIRSASVDVTIVIGDRPVTVTGDTPESVLASVNARLPYVRGLVSAMSPVVDLRPLLQGSGR